MEVLYADLQTRDEIFKGIATVYKKTLDALLDVGFHRDEAIQILVHQGTSIKAN